MASTSMLMATTGGMWRRAGVKPLGLGEGAGKAVEDVAVGGVGQGEARGDHLVDEVVGDEHALAHEVFGHDAEGGVVGAVLAEEVAGGDLRDAELGHQSLAWVPLPTPGAPRRRTGPGRKAVCVGLEIVVNVRDSLVLEAERTRG